MNKVVAIILGAGAGARMNSSKPKQFLRLGDKPAIIYSIDTFQKCSLVDEIIVVMRKGWIKKTQHLISKYNFSKVSSVIIGGRIRMDSAYNALLFLKKNRRPKIVVIHDAVRPFVTQKIIVDSIRAAVKYGAADVVAKTTDTIIMAENNFIKEIPDRRYLFNGQTPQTFRYDLILKAHEFARRKNIPYVTDDAKLVLNMGKKVRIVNGDYENIKLTTKADIELAETINKRRKKGRR